LNPPPGQQRGCHADAGAKRRPHFASQQGLAAQHAMLVGKREPHGLEFEFLDVALEAHRHARLLGAPQSVTLDEAGS
jgi:hypothetical protein